MARERSCPERTRSQLGLTDDSLVWGVRYRLHVALTLLGIGPGGAGPHLNFLSDNANR
jgi:hypothetical protein